MTITKQQLAALQRALRHYHMHMQREDDLEHIQKLMFTFGTILADQADAILLVQPHKPCQPDSV